jgi:hypothetical protein
VESRDAASTLLSTTVGRSINFTLHYCRPPSVRPNNLASPPSVRPNNSQKFTETSELFAILPIAVVAGFSNGSTVLAPLPGSQALCTIKSDFLTLIHQADITVNGKSIESTQPFINIARHFQLISEMSVNDLATLGHSMGFSPTLDNPKSAENINQPLALLLALLVMNSLIIVYLPLLQTIKQL